MEYKVSLNDVEKVLEELQTVLSETISVTSDIGLLSGEQIVNEFTVGCLRDYFCRLGIITSQLDEVIKHISRIDLNNQLRDIEKKEVLEDIQEYDAFWVQHKPNVLRAIKNVQADVPLETLNGYVTTNEGDWIIEGVNGELYPCDKDIFKELYEVLGDNNLFDTIIPRLEFLLEKGHTTLTYSSWASEITSCKSEECEKIPMIDEQTIVLSRFFKPLEPYRIDEVINKLKKGWFY